MKTAILAVRSTFPLLLILAFTAPAYADGKFFIREELPPPGLPYQRALILFDGEREVLVLQSRYEFADEQSVADFGWVVPVPAKPELASMKAGIARCLFFRLDQLTAPKATIVMKGVRVFLFVFLAMLPVGLILWRRKTGRMRSLIAILCTLSWVLLLLLLPALLIPQGSSGGRGVEVLDSKTVGIYDVKVVTAEDAGDLTNWLNENGYGFGPADLAVFESYLRQGWCFVTARISPKARRKAGKHFTDSLPDPLILDFPTAEAVYPLALTGTIGEETEVLLYVLAPHRMTCGERMQVRASVKSTTKTGSFPPLTWGTVPECLATAHIDHPWLTKFKARLSPEEMREDLVLEYAEEDEPYREHVWRLFP